MPFDSTQSLESLSAKTQAAVWADVGRLAAFWFKWGEYNKTLAQSAIRAEHTLRTATDEHYNAVIAIASAHFGTAPEATLTIEGGCRDDRCYSLQTQAAEMRANALEVAA